jgi:Lrp/AsnC family transcriptional regulator for asnA, asnC and gidA
MDELDQKLLNELESQGFQKAAALAAKLGVGERSIQRRIRNMRNGGIIKVIAIPNLVLLGYKAWATIGIRVEVGCLDNVSRELIKHPPTHFVGTTIGEFDIMVDAAFYTFDELSLFVNSELRMIKGILGSEAMLLMSPRKYYRFLWPGPVVKRGDAGWQVCPNSVSHNLYRIDETDRRILNILKQDGLICPAALAAKLGISESTIRRRKKNMLSQMLFSLEVVPNPEVLQYVVLVMMGININHRLAHEVIEALIKNSAVYFASQSIGKFNVIITARFRNIDLLNHFINVELPAVEGITSVHTFLINKTLKYHGIAWSYPPNGLHGTHPCYANNIYDSHGESWSANTEHKTAT